MKSGISSDLTLCARIARMDLASDPYTGWRKPTKILIISDTHGQDLPEPGTLGVVNEQRRQETEQFQGLMIALRAHGMTVDFNRFNGPQITLPSHMQPSSSRNSQASSTSISSQNSQASNTSLSPPFHMHSVQGPYNNGTLAFHGLIGGLECSSSVTGCGDLALTESGYGCYAPAEE